MEEQASEELALESNELSVEEQTSDVDSLKEHVLESNQFIDVLTTDIINDTFQTTDVNTNVSHLHAKVIALAVSARSADIDNALVALKLLHSLHLLKVKGASAIHRAMEELKIVFLVSYFSNTDKVSFKDTIKSLVEKMIQLFTKSHKDQSLNIFLTTTYLDSINSLLSSTPEADSANLAVSVTVVFTDSAIQNFKRRVRDAVSNFAEKIYRYLPGVFTVVINTF